MTESRDPILPDGMSNLLDRIHQKENDEQRLATILRFTSRSLIPVVIGRLVGKIDQELICAEGKELALPLIREIVREELLLRNPTEVLLRDPTKASIDALIEQMTETLTEATWFVMVERRKGIPVRTELARFEEFLKSLPSARKNTEANG